ncbi:MAG: amidohydrolase family protein [Aliishimia sp.]
MSALCLPPLDAPSAPQVKLPDGACDCHAHVILAETAHPFDANRSYTPPPATADAYLALHKRLGIQRAVIVQPSVYGTDNSVTLDAIAQYGTDCRGVPVIEPDCSAAELATLDASGIRGARINTLFGGGIDIGDLEALAGRVADLDWHLQLLIDDPTLAELAPKLASLPVQIVVDHMGHIQAGDGLNQPGFVALRRLVATGKTWVKLSGNYRVSDQRPDFEDAIPFARTLIKDATDRMVWGTDWPHPALFDFMPDDGKLLDALDTYVEADTQKHAILVDNPATLYGFGNQAN